jgi:3-methyl-2-oxobutanoate hydroxymethyltransferase
LLECVPNDLSKEITSLLKIPVIGIGAGPETDGQIMVIHDLLGISCLEKPPKFVKDFLKGSPSIEAALGKYVKSVKSKKFPSRSNTFF